MRLDSVRELKRSLPAQPEQDVCGSSRGRQDLQPRGRQRGVAEARSPSYFLGISARGKKNYRLAVRLQDRALERSELVDRIAARGQGGGGRALRGPHPRPRQAVVPIEAAPAAHRFVHRVPGQRVHHGRHAGVLRAVRVVERAVHPLEQPRPGGREPVPQGRNIVQPGALDGGSPTADRVAKLTRFVRLDPGQTNFVDCAIAKLNSTIQADVHKLKGIGTLAGQRSSDLQVGDVVHKVGRTTGVRHGRVTAFELDGVAVEYDIGVISFDNQIEIEGAGNRSFSDAGDSGSLIVDDQMRAAALLFAGGDHGGSNGKGLTYANPIGAVLQALKVKLA